MSAYTEMTEWSLRDAVQDLLDHGIDVRPGLLYWNDGERAEFEKMEPEGDCHAHLGV